MFDILLCVHYRSARSESLFIDGSTIDQNTVRDIATKTTQCGGNYLDSPVSGGRSPVTWLWEQVNIML